MCNYYHSALVGVSKLGLFWLTALSILAPSLSVADEPAGSISSATASPSAESRESTRYGLFNLLDHRSSYGQGVFPEPFLVDESDVDNEARLDWLHMKGNDQHSDNVKIELEKSFGLLTLELELSYERDKSASTVLEGVGNINLGARYPIYQFVSGDEIVDATFGAALEAGIPVNSSISKNAEVVPKIFNDLRLGDHVTLQSVVGYSTLLGGGQQGGQQTLEYGFVLGYTIQHKELPLPGVQQFIPIFELRGDTALNKNNPGRTTLFGDLAFRCDLRTIGQVQPRLGLGFVFPMNRGARVDTHWGVITSLVFEY